MPLFYDLFNDPSRSPWSGPRRPASPDSQLRVSDAERRAVADTLSVHFGDGRLDQEEFNERLGTAMSAKTRADLAPLLADLPRLEPSGPPPKNRRGAFVVLLLVAVIVLLASATAAVLHHPGVPWLLIGLIVFVAARRHRHHHHGAHGRFPSLR